MRDRIGISSNFSVTPADIVALPDLIAVGAGGVVNYFTNSFDTTTDGGPGTSSRISRLSPVR